MSSVLSAQSDGMGYFYGFAPNDYRRIDVKHVVGTRMWAAYVAGVGIGLAPTKDAAEQRALDYMKANPEPVRDEEE